jgi:hypothetical protein
VEAPAIIKWIKGNAGKPAGGQTSGLDKRGARSRRIESRRTNDWPDPPGANIGEGYRGIAVFPHPFPERCVVMILNAPRLFSRTPLQSVARDSWSMPAQEL